MHSYLLRKSDGVEQALKKYLTALCPMDMVSLNPCLVAMEPTSNLTLKINKRLTPFSLTLA